MHPTGGNMFNQGMFGNQGIPGFPSQQFNLQPGMNDFAKQQFTQGFNPFQSMQQFQQPFQPQMQPFQQIQPQWF